MGVKQAPVTFLRRCSTGYKGGISVVLGVSSLVGLIFGITGAPPNAPLWLGLVVALVVALGFAAAYASGALAHIPSLFVDEIGSEADYRVVPSSYDQLVEACQLVAPIFGVDQVEADQLETWRSKNPLGFFAMLNNYGEVVGYFVIIGVHPKTLTSFIRGDIEEHDIERRDVLSPNQTFLSRELYLSGIMVRHPNTMLGSKRARVLLWAMIKYMEFYFPKDLVINSYALALNSISERLLQAFGFKIASSRAVRKDEHNLYVATINRRVLHNWMARTGDFSLMCELEFPSAVALPGKPRQDRLFWRAAR